MEELIKLVSQNVGISEDLAKQAVETVLGYLKDQLPAPLAGQIHGLLGGEGAPQGLGGLLQGLGGLLGKK